MGPARWCHSRALQPSLEVCAGETPAVYTSNRNTTTHFKERGIFIRSTENCQLALTLRPLTENSSG